MQIPPDTSNLYMLLGYAVVLLILFGLVIYVINRGRRLRSEIKMLEDLEHEEQAGKPKREQP